MYYHWPLAKVGNHSERLDAGNTSRGTDHGYKGFNDFGWILCHTSYDVALRLKQSRFDATHHIGD
jgi:hypothetical protein